MDEIAAHLGVVAVLGVLRLGEQRLHCVGAGAFVGSWCTVEAAERLLALADAQPDGQVVIYRGQRVEDEVAEPCPSQCFPVCLVAPLRLDDASLGALWVADCRPQVFLLGARTRLQVLASRLAERVASMERRQARPPLGLIEAAVEPAFAELRNLLMPLQLTALEARLTSDEGAWSVDPVGQAAAVGAHLAVIEAVAARLTREVETLEDAATVGAGAPSLGAVVRGRRWRGIIRSWWVGCGGRRRSWSRRWWRRGRWRRRWWR
ncbi:MAG: hypothetical protein R3F65_10765 [bacterium]